MATTKFYLDLRGKAKDKKGSVLISLCHNGTVTTISTGIRVAKSEWDGKAVVKRADCMILNAQLSNKKAEVDSAIATLSLAESFAAMTASQIKQFVCKKGEIKDRHLVTTLFDEYIKTELSEGTRYLYRTTLEKIVSRYGNKLRIDCITPKWLYEFDQSLAQTQGVNGRSIYMRCLRAVCNYARKTGVISSYPFGSFSIKSEQTRKRNIDIEELRRFKDFPTTVLNDMYRDYFFLSLYLIGINTVDLLLAKKSDMIKGRLEYTRQKTKKHYSIKIEPEAQKLIDKHTGKGEYLLDAMDHCQHYRSFAHMMNDALKTIGPAVTEEVPCEDELFDSVKPVKKIEPIIPNISSYFARHTWATVASELDIPFDTISQALGHSSGNRTTMIYIKFDQKKIDKANRKVIDYINYK